MNTITSCPHCRQSVQVPETLMGKNVKCPMCGTAFVASAPGEHVPSPLPPSLPEPYSSSPESYSPAEAYSSASGPSDFPERRPTFREHDPYDDRDRYGRRLEPHRGSTVLVLGILGLVVCGILGIIAWVMGSADLAKMREGTMDPEGEGMTRAGQICGIVSTLLIILGIVFGIIIFAILQQAAPPRRF
jgi:hypothetical protein